MVQKLEKIKTKWWWHESALIKEIGLQGTETATARDRLGLVVAHVKTNTCEEQRFGSKEIFMTAAGEAAKNQPRWSLVGDGRTSNKKYKTTIFTY